MKYKYYGPISEKQLKDEMENWTLYDNLFLYKRKLYYFQHEPGSERYNVGVANSLKDEENWSYPDFESVMEATFLDGKPFRVLLPDLDWY